MDDAVAGSSSSEQSSIHSIQGDEQAEDSGIGSDDEPEGAHVRAML